MQFFTTLFTLFVFVSASTASNIVARQGPPSCALSCLKATNTFGCSSTDNACLCRNQQFIAAQETCVAAACTNPNDLAQATTFATQLCLFVGVTLTSVSPSATAGTATASSNGTAAATASSTAAAKSSSTAPAKSTSTSTSNSGAVIASSGTFAMLAGVAAVAIAL